MFFIVHEDPNFVITEDMTLFTPEGPLELDEGDCVSLYKDESDRLFIGIEYDEDCDVLEVSTQTTARDLLEKCSPATFELGLDEDGDESVKVVMVENKSTLTEKIEKLFLLESTPTKTILVNKIR